MHLNSPAIHEVVNFPENTYGLDLILLGTKIDPHKYKVVFHVEFQTTAWIITSLFGKL